MPLALTWRLAKSKFIRKPWKLAVKPKELS
jgi:hypothetical protein